MSTSNQPPSSGSSKRPILGSFLSALAGWIALMLVTITFNSVRYFRSSPKLKSADWVNTPGFYAFFGAIAGVFIFGTWLVVLIPLYSRIPLNSILWRWPICTACGTVAGAAIMFLICRVTSPQAEWQDYTMLAGIVGAFTCLFASLTRRRFRG